MFQLVSRKVVPFGEDKARQIGEEIGIHWDEVEFPVSEFAKGLQVEFEHGYAGQPATDLIGHDVHKSGKIAWAHLNELPDYYTRLSKMEQSAAEE